MLTLDLDYKTRTFFFKKAIKPQDRPAIVEQVRSAFNSLDGVIKSLVISDTQIKVEWNSDLSKPNELAKIAAILTEGNYLDGMLLLELFLSERPNEPDLLYNLGMAYSDQSIFPRAIELLSHLKEIEPDHFNGRVALGVAFIRADKSEMGINELRAVVAQAPDNVWAHKNLGAGLARLNRFAEAEGSLQIATELSPQDQLAWYSYAQVLEALGSLDADTAYIKAIQADEFSQIAELAREARNRIVQKTFRENAAGAPRMDAVMYCLKALELFASMNVDQIKKIGLEIAALGTRGFAVNDPQKHYTLKTLPGEYTGLHLLSIEYVAFKKFAPAQDIGFDLSAEYETAVQMFQK